MDKQELRRLKASIDEFIAGSEAVLVFEVADPDLPPEVYYHRAVSGNPFKSFFTVLIMSFCKLLPASEFKNKLYRLLGMKVGKQVRETPRQGKHTSSYPGRRSDGCP